jgi:AcrR family transcriptional regulator
VNPTLGPVARRSYSSPPRAARARQTRRRLVGAATSLFVARGYAATTMRAVAELAGVSLPALELAFGTKPRLLAAAIDVAIAGDDEPVPVLARDWAACAVATGTARDFLAVVGAVVRAASLRSAGLVAAAFEAAPGDPALRALADQLVARHLRTVGWIVDRLVERAPLRAGLTREAAIDSVWILMEPVVFLRLTRDRGWSPARFEAWFVESVARLVVDEHGRRSE